MIYEDLLCAMGLRYQTRVCDARTLGELEDLRTQIKRGPLRID
jgi:hypothetical protein